MTSIHERNKREVWFLTSSQLVWDDAQLQEKIRKKKIQEVFRLLQGTDILTLFHQFNFSPYPESPKLVTTFWKQADNPVFWSDSSS